jgi:hypothetical protein
MPLPNALFSHSKLNAIKVPTSHAINRQASDSQNPGLLFFKAFPREDERQNSETPVKAYFLESESIPRQ